MKHFTLRLLCLTPMFVACAMTHAQTANPSLTIGDKKLTLEMNTKCPQPRPSRKQLAQYLAQYDPRQEEGLPIHDEDRPFTQKNIKERQDDLVQDGFEYPNGKESVITWMDFDGDGICDFTASAGIGGMRSVDRMFLFRGLPNGKFKLMDSYFDYMNTSITLVPYVPVQVSGEKLPVIIGNETLMQWQSKHRKFVKCEESSVIAKHKKQLGKENKKPQTLMDELCSHKSKIYEWAKNQLPHENSLSMLLFDQVPSDDK